MNTMKLPFRVQRQVKRGLITSIPWPNVINLFTVITYKFNFCNKLMCFSLAGLSSLVYSLRVKPEPNQAKHLSGIRLQGRLLALTTDTGKAYRGKTPKLIKHIRKLCQKKSFIILKPGPSVIKKFTVIYECPNRTIVYVPDRSSKPCLMFATKARAYPSKAPSRCSTLEQTPGLTHQHLTGLNDLTSANTLAYFEQITIVKGFISLRPG